MTRGGLKVFLGMAAGVGKTVAMLREGRRLRGEGLHVACGILETHGRAETIAEIGDLRVIPRLDRVYRGVPLPEMDLDALLAERPDVALVDELAHTNVPGGRHEKRWEDVEELLDAGISVLTTMNVQHLESLHDVVRRLTGVTVRERVPDRIVGRAAEIVVVDLTPEELQRRLREGKIYPAHKVEQALDGFFKHENLASLRQLVLREVANEVEDRRLGPADAERVMVCMSSQPTATARLLRHGARIAGGVHARWFVVYVRTPAESTQRIDSGALRSLTTNIKLARELGAEVVALEGTEIAPALARFARDKGITHAVFGRTRLPAWRDRLRGSVLDRFMREAPDVDVVVVGVAREEEPS